MGRRSVGTDPQAKSLELTTHEMSSTLQEEKYKRKNVLLHIKQSVIVPRNKCIDSNLEILNLFI